MDLFMFYNTIYRTRLVFNCFGTVTVNLGFTTLATVQQCFSLLTNLENKIIWHNINYENEIYYLLFSIVFLFGINCFFSPVKMLEYLAKHKYIWSHEVINLF